MSSLCSTETSAQAGPPWRVAVSPCPNDTFIFAAWMLGLTVPDSGRPARFFWADVQDLNQQAAAGKRDVVKVSAVQGLALRQEYGILPCGGAFGLQAGPKVVKRPGRHPVRRVGVPGLQTTAYALLRGAWGPDFEPIPLRYDRIPKAVQVGAVDAGLLIHESALVFARYGLECALDLGAWWTAHSGGLPLPLGVILVHHRLGEAAQEAIAAVIQASLRRARTTPEAVWPLVQALAQEMDQATLQAHINAYVNEFSLDHTSNGGDDALELLGQLVAPSEAAAQGPFRP